MIRRAFGFALVLALIATVAHAGTLTVQTLGETGFAPTFVAASAGGDTFANTKGNVILLLRNTDAAATTATIVAATGTVTDANRGTLTKANATVVVPKIAACISGANAGATCSADSACPGSICGLGGGIAMVGPFVPLSFNDALGRATVTYSSVTTLYIAAIKVPE